MRSSLVKIFSVVVSAAYLASCSTLPKPASLPSMSPAISHDEKRNVLFSFRLKSVNIEGETFDASSFIETAILDKLMAYWGSSTTFTKTSSTATVDEMFQTARRSRTITDVVIVKLELNSEGSHYNGTKVQRIKRNLSGGILFYSVKSGELIGEFPITASVSLDNSEAGPIMVILGGLVYNFGIVLPLVMLSGFTVCFYFDEKCTKGIMESISFDASPRPEYEVLPIVYNNLMAQVDVSAPRPFVLNDKSRKIGLVVRPKLDGYYKELIVSRFSLYIGNNWEFVELNPASFSEKDIISSVNRQSTKISDIVIIDLKLHISEKYNSKYMHGNKDKFWNLGPPRKTIWEPMPYGLIYRAKETLTHTILGEMRLLKIVLGKVNINQTVNVEAGVPLGVVAFEARNGKWTESLKTDVCDPQNRRYSRMKATCKKLVKKEPAEVEQEVRNSITVQLDEILKEFATQCLISFSE